MHPLHKLIAQILIAAEIPDCEPLLGNDCGGDQHIQLFCSDEPSRKTRLCSVDAAVLKAGNLNTIMEIEESDIRPMALCGKVAVSAFASHFIHKGRCFPIAANASFVQIIDTRKLAPNSSKLAQCLKIQTAIGEMLSMMGRNLRHYQIFYGDLAEFERQEAQEELVRYLAAQASN